MWYKEFEKIISPVRVGRYLPASRGNTRLAMTLYRKNLKLSQEFFTVISCFEVKANLTFSSRMMPFKAG